MTRLLRVLPVVALLVLGCKEKPHRMGASVNIAPTGINQVISASVDPNAANLPGAVGTIIQVAGGGKAYAKGADGLWHVFPNTDAGSGSSGGGIAPDGGVKFPLGGVGTVANPIALPSQWRQLMFAYAVSKYPTIGTDFILEYTLGASATGDYGASTNQNAVANYSTAVNNGDVQLDTGSTTINNTTVYVFARNNPTIVANVATGAPWFCAGRAKLETTPGASGQTFPMVLTQISPFGFGAPAIGFLGSTSTTNLTLVDGAAGIATSKAADFTAFHDYGVGFDGVTITGYYGDVALGTMAAIATSTNLTGLHSGAGQPVAYINSSGTTRQLMDTAVLYCAMANP